MKAATALAIALMVSGCLCLGAKQDDGTSPTTNPPKDQGKQTQVTNPPQTGQDNNPFSGIDCFACDHVGDPVAKKDCQRHCKN